MALICKPSSSSAPLDQTPRKIKVQTMRMWKGNKKESSNLIDMVLIDSSGPRIHTTIGEAFSKWIMDISDGKINEANDGETEIDIPKALLIIECGDPIKTIVREVYGESFTQSYNPDFCQERAILCHKSESVDRINNHMLSRLPGEMKVYHGNDSVALSDDCLRPLSDSSPTDYMPISPGFFGSNKIPGLPNQSLRLKVGAPVMLLRDIDPNHGLCSGTRLQITRLDNSILEARFITGNKNSEKVLIPMMPTYPTDAKFPILMRRMQFPVTLAFVMTLKKSQGLTFSKVGLYLPRRRGPTYVAISKVKSRSGLEILITDKDGKPQEETNNVVFKELFQNV